MPSCAAQSALLTNGPQGCGCTAGGGVGTAGGVDVYLSNQGSNGDGSKGGSGGSKNGSGSGSKRRRSSSSSSRRKNRSGSGSGSGSGSSTYSSSSNGCCGSDGSRKRCRRACGGIGARSRGGNGRRAKKSDRKLLGLRSYGWVQQFPYVCRVYFSNISGY